jgi:hypothetical protein
VTQLITGRLLRWAKALVVAQLVLTAIVAVLLAALVFGNLPRLQETTDSVATAQSDLRVVVTGTAESALLARQAAESADRTLTSALAALATPNPATTYTRAQLTALCEQLLGRDCPPPPSSSTTSTTVGS